MKIEKIEKDMQKTREKITELQNRLKELDALKTEQENLQIVQLVRTLRISPQELKEFLQGSAETAPVPTAETAYTYQSDDEQEDIDDEE